MDIVWKKIILTTDQELIEEGIQAIDDEFLEWFVKNPSCEFVEVKKGFEDGTAWGYNFLDYKIIIPQEESKQEGYICPHTKIQCDDECCVSAEDCHITSSLASGIVDCDEPKQETLEEYSNGLYKQSLKDDVDLTFSDGVKLGAKWQAERMYSEEELKNAIEISVAKALGVMSFTINEESFEQFKKK